MIDAIEEYISKLEEQIDKGNLPEVNKLPKNIIVVNEYNDTILHYLLTSLDMGNGNDKIYQIIEHILKSKPSLQFRRNKVGMSVLARAVEIGDNRAVRLCLQYGANPNGIASTIDGRNELLLSLAMKSKNADTVAALLECDNIKINYSDIKYNDLEKLIFNESGLLNKELYDAVEKKLPRYIRRIRDEILQKAIKNDNLNLIEAAGGDKFLKYFTSDHLEKIAKEKKSSKIAEVINKFVPEYKQAGLNSKKFEDRFYKSTDINFFDKIKKDIDNTWLNVKDNEDNTLLYSILHAENSIKTNNNYKKAVSDLLELLKYAIKAGANFIINKKEETILHYAIENNRLDIAEFAIENGADVNARNSNGQTALHYLTEYYRDSSGIKFLLENGANINARDINGQTALHYAAKKGEYDKATLLIENNIDVNAVDNIGKPALHYAIENCHYEFVELLIENGTNLSIKNQHGNTAYDVAKKCNGRILKTIIKKKYNDLIKKYGDLAIIPVAISMGALISLLLISLTIFLSGPTLFSLISGYSIGASVTVWFVSALPLIPFMWNDLWVTTITEARLIFSTFKSAASRGFGLGKWIGKDAIISEEREKPIPVQKIILDEDLNLRDHSGETALHRAAEKGNTDFAISLLERGANPNIGNDIDEYPIHMAAEQNNIELVRALIKHKANLDAQLDYIEEVDPFAVERSSSQDKIFRDTALHIAVKNQHYELAALLVSKGAKIDIQDGDGKTAIDILKDQDMNHLANALEKKAEVKFSKGRS